MTSNMVSGGGRATTAATAPNSNRQTRVSGPVISRSRLAEADAFPIPKLDFRKGRCAVWKEFVIVLTEMLDAWGLGIEFLATTPPDVTTPQVQTRESNALLEAETTALEEYQRMNTALYWQLVAALIIQPLRSDKDRKAIAAFRHLDVASGTDLFKWIANWMTVDDVASQTRLMTLLQTSKLKVGTTTEQLEAHCHMMLEAWTLVASNDISKPLLFYQQLEMSMPKLPEGAHLVTTRTWFALEVEAYKSSIKRGASHVFDDPHNAIDLIVERAKVIGVPSSIKETTLNFLSFELGCGDCDDDNADAPSDEMLMPLGDRGLDRRRDGKQREGEKKSPKRSPADNDCDNCSSWWCVSNRHGGSKACICKHGSKFKLDAKVMGTGGVRFAKTARAWDKANPGKSMKGVSFRVTDANKPNGSTSDKSVRFRGQQVTPIVEIDDLFDDDEDRAGFDAWLRQHGTDDASSLMPIVNLGKSVLVEAVEAAPTSGLSSTPNQGEQPHGIEAPGTRADADWQSPQHTLESAAAKYDRIVRDMVTPKKLTLGAMTGLETVPAIDVRNSSIGSEHTPLAWTDDFAEHTAAVRARVAKEGALDRGHNPSAVRDLVDTAERNIVVGPGVLSQIAQLMWPTDRSSTKSSKSAVQLMAEAVAVSERERGRESRRDQYALRHLATAIRAMVQFGVRLTVAQGAALVMLVKITMPYVMPMLGKLINQMATLLVRRGRVGARVAFDAIMKLTRRLLSGELMMPLVSVLAHKLEILRGDGLIALVQKQLGSFEGVTSQHLLTLLQRSSAALGYSISLLGDAASRLAAGDTPESENKSNIENNAPVFEDNTHGLESQSSDEWPDKDRNVLLMLTESDGSPSQAAAGAIVQLAASAGSWETSLASVDNLMNDDEESDLQLTDELAEVAQVAVLKDALLILSQVGATLDKVMVKRINLLTDGPTRFGAPQIRAVSAVIGKYARPDIYDSDLAAIGAYEASHTTYNLAKRRLAPICAIIAENALNGTTSGAVHDASPSPTGVVAGLDTACLTATAVLNLEQTGDAARPVRVVLTVACAAAATELPRPTEQVMLISSRPQTPSLDTITNMFTVERHDLLGDGDFGEIIIMDIERALEELEAPTENYERLSRTPVLDEIDAASMDLALRFFSGVPDEETMRPDAKRHKCGEHSVMVLGDLSISTDDPVPWAHQQRATCPVCQDEVGDPRLEHGGLGYLRSLASLAGPEPVESRRSLPGITGNVWGALPCCGCQIHWTCAQELVRHSGVFAAEHVSAENVGDSFMHPLDPSCPCCRCTLNDRGIFSPRGRLRATELQLHTRALDFAWLRDAPRMRLLLRTTGYGLAGLIHSDLQATRRVFDHWEARWRLNFAVSAPRQRTAYAQACLNAEQCESAVELEHAWRRVMSTKCDLEVQLAIEKSERRNNIAWVDRGTAFKVLLHYDLAYTNTVHVVVVDPAVWAEYEHTAHACDLDFHAWLMVCALDCKQNTIGDVMTELALRDKGHRWFHALTLACHSTGAWSTQHRLALDATIEQAWGGIEAMTLEQAWGSSLGTCMRIYLKIVSVTPHACSKQYCPSLACRIVGRVTRFDHSCIGCARARALSSHHFRECVDMGFVRSPHVHCHWCDAIDSASPRTTYTDIAEWQCQHCAASITNVPRLQLSDTCVTNLDPMTPVQIASGLLIEGQNGNMELDWQYGYEHAIANQRRLLEAFESVRATAPDGEWTHCDDCDSDDAMSDRGCDPLNVGGAELLASVRLRSLFVRFAQQQNYIAGLDVVINPTQDDLELSPIVTVADWHHRVTAALHQASIDHEMAESSDNTIDQLVGDAKMLFTASAVQAVCQRQQLVPSDSHTAEVVTEMAESNDSTIDQLVGDAEMLFTVGAVSLKLGAAAVNAKPPPDIADDIGHVPALCDDGASLLANCTRSLDGAIPGTHRPEDAVSLGVGNDEASLVSEGTHWFLYWRYGATGKGEMVARRMHYTPNLNVPIVFSEAAEVYHHQYSIAFDRVKGRVFTPPNGEPIRLFMSSTKLGWFKVKPIKDKAVISRVVQQADTMRKGGTVMIIGDGEPKTTGMPRTALTGVAFLRRKHTVMGHVSLERMLLTLAAQGKFGKRFTRVDVKAFAAQGCGVCESAKMRRRAFTLRTIQDKTVPQVGKKWIMDQLSLRVPTAWHGYVKLSLAVDANSKVKFVTGMMGETAEDIRVSREQLRAFVRPTHGEIHIIRADDHPSHGSRSVADYMALSPHGSVRNDIGPGHVHETVGDCENTFMHQVPSANALLMAAPDLGEAHFFSAFKTAIAATDTAATVGSDPVTSPLMRYLQTTEWRPSPLMGYGAAGKALIHPEARDSKYELHATPVCYCGPAHLSSSIVHAAVWDGTRYYDVDVGCLNVCEDEVIDRTRRNHPSHQPFNQPENADVKPHERAVASAATLEEDPYHEQRIWTPGSTVTYKSFSLGIAHGAARAGDVASWLWHMTKSHVHIRIDLKCGGYAHDLMDPRVISELKSCANHAACRGVFLGIPCAPWSAARFAPMDGGKTPVPYFTLSHPTGVPGLTTEQRSSASRAVKLMENAVAVLHAGLSRQPTPTLALSEHPVSQAEHSPFYSRGLEEHLTMHEMPQFVKLIEEHRLRSVLTDQCMSGAPTRKSTQFLACPVLEPQLTIELGTLRCPGAREHGHTREARLIGLAGDGKFRTTDAERYPSQLAQRESKAIASTMAWQDRSSVPTVPEEGGEDQCQQCEPEQTEELMNHQADDDRIPFPITSRVEIYWTKEKQWFAGEVINVGTQTVTLKGRKITTPTITVEYDDGVKKADGDDWVHSLHNNSVRLLSPPREPTLNVLLADRLSLPFDLATGEEPEPDDATFTVVDFHIDMETLDVLNTISLYSIGAHEELVQGKTIDTVDTSQARHWHCPQNEREYNRSPQKSMWRTAKELKWSEYIELKMFSWIPVSRIDTKRFKIYNTLWAYKIKMNSDLTFDKLNPRWCFKGGTMDRSVYKSFAETMRMASFRTILALKGGYYDIFCAFKCDCSNAFQATRTDDPKDGPQPKLYCWPAPGFERRGPNGERMACELHVGMQGRIDATRLFSDKLFKLLVVAGFMRSMWDHQVYIYHVGPYANTAAPLTTILANLKDCKDSEGQQPPVGYAVIGWHVDDGIGVACDVGHHLDYTNNRVVKYLEGVISVTYALKLGPWTGGKALGFKLTCNDDTKRVSLGAPDALQQLAKDVLSGHTSYAPKHIMTEEFMDIKAGVEPDKDDPGYETVMAEMGLGRHALGVCIWLYNAYIQAQAPTCMLCAGMSFPTPQVLKLIRHMVMHLIAHPDEASWGGWECNGLEQPEELITPFTEGKKAMYYHYFSDANLGNRSIQGGVGFLAGGPIQAVCQRQQLASPDSHTAEVVAAGNNLNQVVPQNGLLQELHIRQGMPTPFYLDSATTVFVAQNDTAVKRSVWLIRRALVLQDGVEYDEINPIHISEQDMVADPFTKYLVFPVWRRHMWYLLNQLGSAPPRHKKK